MAYTKVKSLVDECKSIEATLDRTQTEFEQKLLELRHAKTELNALLDSYVN